jgi:hypothetical protein
MQTNLQEKKCAVGSGAACPRHPHAQTTSAVTAPPRIHLPAPQSPCSQRPPVQNSVASGSPAFPAAAEKTRRTTTCTCRRRGHGVLPNHRAALVPRAETSIAQTMPGLPAAPRQPVTRYASLITRLHPASTQSKDYEIPGAPVAFCYAILRFISVNNAQLRISENALPFTQYDEIASSPGLTFALSAKQLTNYQIAIRDQQSCASRPSPAQVENSTVAKPITLHASPPTP